MSVFLVIKQYTLSLSMVQQFYLIYCVPVHIYELVFPLYKAGNSGLCFYVQSGTV